MRKISEKTILTALVNYKCVGYFGKCFKSLNSNERDYVIDELVKRGYLDENMTLTKKSKQVILDNSNLCQY